MFSSIRILIAPFIFYKENSIPFRRGKAYRMNLSNPPPCFSPHFTRSIYFFHVAHARFIISLVALSALHPRSRINAYTPWTHSKRISYDVIRRSKRSTFSQWHDKSPSNARFILSVNLLDTGMRG